MIRTAEYKRHAQECHEQAKRMLRPDESDALERGKGWPMYANITLNPNWKLQNHRTPHVRWRLNSSGSFATFAAIRRASLRVSSFAARRRSKIIFADAAVKAAAGLRCSGLAHWN